MFRLNNSIAMEYPSPPMTDSMIPTTNTKIPQTARPELSSPNNLDTEKLDDGPYRLASKAKINITRQMPSDMTAPDMADTSIASFNVKLFLKVRHTENAPISIVKISETITMINAAPTAAGPISPVPPDIDPKRYPRIPMIMNNTITPKTPNVMAFLYIVRMM